MNQNKNQYNNIQEEIIKRMVNDRKFRIGLSKKSFYWFCQYYFRGDLKIPTAEFHKEIIQFLQGKDKKLVVLAGFRGCGKSTLANRMYSIWAVLGVQEKRFVVISGQTQRQSEQYLLNIKEQFEKNPQLISDFSPFREDRDQWGRLGIVMSYYKAKILAASCEQPIRGMTFLGHRPDLFILDDLESPESVKTDEGRRKLLEWYQRDILPAGDPLHTRIVIIGGILNRDSFVSYFRKGIENKEIDGVFLFYPVIKNGEIIWKDKYPDIVALEAEKRKGQSKAAFDREFMLEITEDENQIIKEEWFKYYDCDQIPEDESEYKFSVVSVDPAVSQNKTSDFTGIICADIYGKDNDKRIYIKQEIINKKMTFYEIKEMVKDLSRRIGRGSLAKIYIEEAGQQGYITQDLIRDGYPAIGIKPIGDKSYRLLSAAAQFQAEKVFLPRNENPALKKLKQQLLGFGTESHDDLLDSCTQLINQVSMELEKPEPRITIFSCGPDSKMEE